jgi:fucose 4-O-acetylase-like acetyltransferase
VTNRIQRIDIAKGITILLVVIGHFPIPVLLRSWIYSFHMPLFFLISGMLFQKEKYTSFRQFFIRRNFSLFFPFIIFSVIIYALTFLIKMNAYSFSLNNGWELALWFIPVLYVTDVIYFLNL